MHLSRRMGAACKRAVVSRKGERWLKGLVLNTGMSNSSGDFVNTGWWWFGKCARSGVFM